MYTHISGASCWRRCARPATPWSMPRRSLGRGISLSLINENATTDYSNLSHVTKGKFIDVTIDYYH